MNRFIDRLKLVFLVFFAIACAASWTYQLMYARPQALCDGRGGWWDWHERVCATPIPLYVLTGHKAQKLGPGDKTPKASPAQTATAPQ